MPASHLPGPALVASPPLLYRISRTARLLEPSRISPADARLPHAGNRFDVAGGGVLYFGSTAQGCFAETLARFRPTSAMRAIVADEDPRFVVCGGVPQDWRTQRQLVTVEAVDALAFVDVEHPDTHEYLTAALASQLSVLGVAQLDVAVLRGSNRILTRTISTWAYAATNHDGTPKYSGIRYKSRLGDHECWAVFDGTVLQVRDRRPIELTDQDLQAVAAQFGLRPF
ncbi:MAG: RES family NAD+ phosphorylase [Mycobacterium sp.]